MVLRTMNNVSLIIPLSFNIFNMTNPQGMEADIRIQYQNGVLLCPRNVLSISNTTESTEPSSSQLRSQSMKTSMPSGPADLRSLKSNSNIQRQTSMTASPCRYQQFWQTSL